MTCVEKVGSATVQPGIQSASRTGQNNGNTCSGVPFIDCVKDRQILRDIEQEKESLHSRLPCENDG